MRILISYPTDIGTFDIGQSENRKYHPIYNDTSLGEYDSAKDAVDALIENKTSPIYSVETGDLVDSSTLGISQDYLEWDSSY